MKIGSLANITSLTLLNNIVGRLSHALNIANRKLLANSISTFRL